MKNQRVLTWALLASVSALALETSAYAAETSSQETGRVEEIVVTAQRRQESMQSVPITVTAITAQDMGKSGVSNVENLSSVVPGLVVEQEESGVDIFLRGIGQSTSQIGVEGSVSIYVDGVYIPNAFGGLFDFNNVERIEVLKGPQGTLFGRNATGGVIQIVTKNPQQTPAVEGYLTYGKFNTIEGGAYLTTGVTDKLAVDLAVHARDEMDGYGRNINSGQETGTDKEINIRSKALFTPNDNLTIKLAGDYTGNKLDIPVGIPPGSIGLDGQPGYVGFFNTKQGKKDESHGKFWGVSGTIEDDLSFARLVSISSYRHTAVNYTVDQDNTPTEIVLAEPDYGRERTFTQELQIQSPSDSKVNWIAGAFYMHDKSGYEPITINGLAVSPLNSLQIIGITSLNSFAGFGQATLEVLPDTHFTAGFRYTHDKRTIVGSSTGFIGATALNLTSAPSSQSATYQKPSWRFSLDHQFDPDILGYISYNRGFKSGFYNTISYSAPTVKPETIDAYEAGLKTEFFNHALRVNAATYIYKVKGLQLPKSIAGSTFFLNAAAATIKGFDLDFVAAPVDNLKIQGGIAYTHGRYSSFPGAPLYTPLPGGGNSLGAFDASGLKTIHTPEWTGNLTASYAIPTSQGTFEPTVTYSYSSSFCWQVDCRIKQNHYGLLNSSIEWTAPSEHWGVSLWAKNLNDARYYSWANEGAPGDEFIAARPRTFGVTVKAKF